MIYRVLFLSLLFSSYVYTADPKEDRDVEYVTTKVEGLGVPPKGPELTPNYENDNKQNKSSDVGSSTGGSILNLLRDIFGGSRQQEENDKKDYDNKKEQFKKIQEQYGVETSKQGWPELFDIYGDLTAKNTPQPTKFENVPAPKTPQDSQVITPEVETPVVPLTPIENQSQGNVDTRYTQSLNFGSGGITCKPQYGMEDYPTPPYIPTPNVAAPSSSGTNAAQEYFKNNPVVGNNKFKMKSLEEITGIKDGTPISDTIATSPAPQPGRAPSAEEIAGGTAAAGTVAAKSGGIWGSIQAGYAAAVAKIQAAGAAVVAVIEAHPYVAAGTAAVVVIGSAGYYKYKRHNEQFQEFVVNSPAMKEIEKEIEKDIAQDIVRKKQLKRNKWSDAVHPNPTADPRKQGINSFFSDKESKVKHIFRDKTGHFKEKTPSAETLIKKTVKDGKYHGQDKAGNHQYSWEDPKTGDQIWAYTRDNGEISNAGINLKGAHWEVRSESPFLVEPYHAAPRKKGEGVLRSIGIAIGSFLFGDASAGSLPHVNISSSKGLYDFSKRAVRISQGLPPAPKQISVEEAKARSSNFIKVTKQHHVLKEKARINLMRRLANKKS